VNFYGNKFGIPNSAKFEPGMSLEEMSDSFRHWDLGENQDILETLNRVHAAVQNAGVVRMLGADISARWGAKTPPVGDGERWVKLVDNKGKSHVNKYVDTSLYYPESIAQQMHVLDSTLKTLHDPLAKTRLTRFYDGALHSLKAGWTIYRPGHHTRNAVGDGFFNFIDNVGIRHHHRALSVLHVGRKDYGDWDSLQALQSAGIMPDEAKIVTRNKQTGQQLTARQAHKLMYQSGTLPDYRVIEDVAFGRESEDIAGKLRELSPFKGRIHDKAAAVSEVRDHYFRAAHWLKAFEDVKIPASIKGETAKMEYAAAEAAKRVRKWHPDGSDLTMFEKKVMRRVIPFYSWMRKAIPLVIEASVTRPGKVLLYPKAMYAMAEAQGIDLESLSNPFPEDQLFPAWLADSVQGPTFKIDGKYYGLRPGIPTADVMGDYMSTVEGTGRTLLGSTTPLVKLPVEAIMQQDSRTGAPIKDASDFIDRQIPGVSNVASMSGYSPTGSLASLANPFNGVADPTQARVTAEKYDEPGSNAIALLNLLTGAGITQMSKPNYIKQAQFEQRDRARKAANGG
jgi:hypothetical protein